MLRLKTIPLTLALLASFASGCDDDDDGGDDMNAGTGADDGAMATGESGADESADEESGAGEEVSLATDALPIVLARCGGCHTRGESPAPAAVVNMVYLEEKDDVLGLVGSFIVAGDSASSGFLSIMRQDLAVGAGPTLMPPPPSAAMPVEEVDMIALWIDQGAQDN